MADKEQQLQEATVHQDDDEQEEAATPAPAGSPPAAAAADEAATAGASDRPDNADDGDDDGGPRPVALRAPLTPPEDCLPVTADGGVLIKTIQPGEGDKPALHARCLGGCGTRVMGPAEGLAGCCLCRCVPPTAPPTCTPYYLPDPDQPAQLAQSATAVSDSVAPGTRAV